MKVQSDRNKYFELSVIVKLRKQNEVNKLSVDFGLSNTHLTQEVLK